MVLIGYVLYDICAAAEETLQVWAYHTVWLNQMVAF